MPRLARFVLPDVALHIIQRGHDRQACFRDDTDRMVYLALLRDCLAKSRCALHSYCLMTNHVHLLLTPPDGRACAVLMRNFGQRYVQYFNRRYDRTGTLWEGRPRSCLVESTRYVLACYRYIELNPVRAGMVDRAAAFKWSSHDGNTGRVDEPLLTPHAEYLALADDQRARRVAYQHLFTSADDPRFLAEVRDATNGGYPLLGTEMKARLAKIAKRRLQRAKPGPPGGDEGGESDQFSGELPF
jgi:putative transposase